MISVRVESVAILIKSIFLSRIYGEIMLLGDAVIQQISIPNTKKKVYDLQFDRSAGSKFPKKI